MTDTARLPRWATRTWAEYETGADQAGENRPLLGYAVLMSGYGAFLSVAGLAARRLAKAGTPPQVPDTLDLALTAVAVFRTSRTLAKDAVTAPLRAPFATYVDRGGPGEVMEAPRPGHVRHAVGELVTCPFCLTQWVSSAAVVGHLFAPRATRWVCAGMSVVAAADALHLAYAKLQQSAS